jgi:hypothetical protein
MRCYLRLKTADLEYFLLSRFPLESVLHHQQRFVFLKLVPCKSHLPSRYQLASQDLSITCSDIFLSRWRDAELFNWVEGSLVFCVVLVFLEMIKFTVSGADWQKIKTHKTKTALFNFHTISQFNTRTSYILQIALNARAL